MVALPRHQRVIIALSVHILRGGVVRCADDRVDSVEVRLALRCLLPHCRERWPLELYWDAAGQGNEIGRAQGVSIAAVLMNNIPVFEYSPKKIKQSVTGNGNATKEQVASMLQRLCNFELQPKFLDATDGLAAAVCHHFQHRGLDPGAKKFTGWKDFLKANPKKEG